MFVATKADILNDTLGEFPAVFVATKPSFFNLFSFPNQTFCSGLSNIKLKTETQRKSFIVIPVRANIYSGDWVSLS